MSDIRDALLYSLTLSLIGKLLGVSVLAWWTGGIALAILPPILIGLLDAGYDDA